MLQENAKKGGGSWNIYYIDMEEEEEANFLTFNVRLSVDEFLFQTI